ncbi:hypothetical protein [Phaeobacter sp. B1627]|uniref:hypothetical protein n=1 Tax=Phaeobacter sp. B1627 TaxID=2583809 RepID=UPI00111A27CD|nr:hypothetical protein [Phaeobacter sp. B1627]TNJ42080.1 hypothetical protein FGE21_12520 [Phaeobacter sp. B1627]
MTWASFNWGGSSWGKSYSFGGKSQFGGHSSSWNNDGWTYSPWSGCEEKSEARSHDHDDKDDDKSGWGAEWGRGKHPSDDENDDSRGKDCDDRDDKGHAGRGGRDRHDDDRGGRDKHWSDRDDDDCGDHGHGHGRKDDDHRGDSRGDDDCDKPVTPPVEDPDRCDDETPDDPGGDEDGKITVDFTLGDSQQLTMEVSQTAEGTLFFKLAPTSWDSEETDLDGIFMNLTDDSTAEGLHIHPDANAIPLTAQEINPNGANSLSDGTTLSENFDIGLQFGQVENSSDGFVQTLNFTLWSDNGPLTLDDIDLSRIALVTGLDDDDPEVIVGGLSDDAEDPAAATLDDILGLMSQDVPDEDAEEAAEEEGELEDII